MDEEPSNVNLVPTERTVKTWQLAGSHFQYQLSPERQQGFCEAKPKSRNWQHPMNILYQNFLKFCRHNSSDNYTEIQLAIHDTGMYTMSGSQEIGNIA